MPQISPSAHKLQSVPLILCQLVDTAEKRGLDRIISHTVCTYVIAVEVAVKKEDQQNVSLPVLFVDKVIRDLKLLLCEGCKSGQWLKRKLFRQSLIPEKGFSIRVL